MFLSLSEAEGGVRVWFNAALKLLFANTVPALPGTTDVLAEPDYAGAKAALDIVLSQRPDWAEAYYYRGIALAGLSKGVVASSLTCQALGDFDAALRLDPRMADVYWERSALYAKVNPRQAIADLSSLLALEPTVAAYLRRAKLSQGIGETMAAVADYRAALKRYTAYCGVAERQQIETYMDRITLELQNHNVQGVLKSLCAFWQQHELTSYH